MRAMHVQTKFLRLCKRVSLGDLIDDWRVCWLGGWDKCHVFFVVMVEREYEQPCVTHDGQRFLFSEPVPVEESPAITMVVNWPAMLRR
jgi:hypothetical protein